MEVDSTTNTTATGPMKPIPAYDTYYYDYNNNIKMHGDFGGSWETVGYLVLYRKTMKLDNTNTHNEGTTD